MHSELVHAYNFCKEIAVGHYENFPVGSLLIPANKRNYIYSIYAFARTADDIADSGILKSNEKIRLLNEYDEELDKISRKDLQSLRKDSKQIFIALSNTIDKVKFPEKELRDLLTAFKMDSVKQTHQSFDDLLEYSSYSANPVGHLVLYVFGFDPEKNKQTFEYSDKICTALQLTNFWQDVKRDLDIGRVYLPVNVMKDFNYDLKMLNEKIENDDFRRMIKSLVDKTKAIFDEGKDIVKDTSGRLRLELKATIAGGNEILNKIGKLNYNVLSERVKINNIDKIKILGKIVW